VLPGHVSGTPIGDHALLSDCHGAALVDRAGSVEWWCTPRFDSPSVFGRLLEEGAGCCRVAPVEAAAVGRRYRDGGLLLETTFATGSGVVELTDVLAMAAGVRDHDLGADSPGVLLRRMVCTSGSVEVEVVCCPRFEYGLTAPAVERAEGLVIARGGPSTLCLSGDVPLEAGEGSVTARVTLGAGESLALAVEHASSWKPLPSPWRAEEIAQRLEDTAEAWRSWQRTHQRYEGPYAELVGHSGRVLQGLTYQPTGAMIAAATTSLPEAVGGERNWDYRYTWVRDASLTLDALWVAACPDEAGSFLDYLTTVATTFHETGDLQIMFGIAGERDLSERELTHLRGWRDSRPVRVGNGAWDQRQLDVYGELLAAVHRLCDQLAPFNALQRRFLVALADAAAARWEETDQGIWEVRGPSRHYLHSKLLCWVALDRAVELAPLLGAEERVPEWTATRQRIGEAILTHGWNDEVGAFTQAFDTAELDASNLLIPILGFLPGNDPRVVSTIAATEARLCDERGLVHRYRADDGLEGEEGAFLLCTFWLAEALARSGDPAHAREVFERAAALAGDVGLLAEEADPTTGELLGNFPQAFSHIGVINAAWAIQQAEAEQSTVDQRPCDVPWHAGR
jgi:GH15 family glucan-1,4-alpha-glucosidase